MRLTRYAALCGITTSLCAILTVEGAAQRGGARSGAPAGQGGRAGAVAPAPAPTAARAVADDPFSGPVVTGAPFSADAVTTVTQVLGDGTRIEQTTTAKFYRDGAGRVRREQTILGLDALNPAGGGRTAITIVPNPNEPTAFTLDPANRTARPVARNSGAVVLVGGDATATGLYVNINNVTQDLATLLTSDRRARVQAGTEPSGVKQPEESLGTRQVEGVTAVGRRTKSVIPVGQIGNDRPIEITDERWESQDLRLLVRSHHRDPRTGDVEYRLTNIQRSEPSADLFVVPSDYTVQGRGGRGAYNDALGAVPPGERTGGGGRGRTAGPGGN